MKDWNKIFDLLITIADMTGAVLKGGKKIKHYYDKKTRVKTTN